MRLTFLGVRGSTPAPGPEYVRYGGHTACVAITPTSSEVPTLALDAGTGLRSLTAMLDGQPYRGSIVLSHLHWDHMQGLPFFTAGDREDAEVTVYMPAQDGLSGHDLLAHSMSPPTFPITPAGLRGTWSFEVIEQGDHVIEGLTVTATQVHHKGGRTFGYRISDGTVDVAYLPDHVVAGGVTGQVEALIRGVDVLFHDAQFVESERYYADTYGHSTVDDAVELASHLDVHTLVLFHHGPSRTDDQLDTIVSELDPPLSVIMAREGQVLELPVGSRPPV